MCRVTRLSAKKTERIVKKFLEGLYPEYEVKSVDVDPKKDGYDIEAEMEERFNPSKRYHASVSVSISIVEF